MDPFEAFRRLHRDGEPGLFFDGVPSAAVTEDEAALRRWSYACVAPVAALCVRGERAWRREGEGAWQRVEGEAWALLRAFAAEGGALVAERQRRSPAPDDPAFPHGVAGLVTYDAGRLIERLPSIARDDVALPDFLVFRFDAIVAIPAGGAPRVVHREGAHAHAAHLAERLARPPAPLPATGPIAVAPEMPAADFEAMVRRGKAHVRDGDVFQVNLSHRLHGATDAPPLALYARLRAANPAPFGGYLASGPLPDDAPPFHILSSSPERLFRLDGARLEARPIAGTRPRGATPAEDEALATELRTDAKERAEHVMLVDLARNDLGRVARYGSVQVPRLLAVETYRTVHHLVSTVEAELAPGRDAIDALVALFPGGTITGAPKVRAMEVIESIEPVRRAAYTGSLGWFGPHGCDFNILIRTLTLRNGTLHLQVGAGIVEDSEPGREHRETLAKAEGMLRALRTGAPQEAAP